MLRGGGGGGQLFYPNGLVVYLGRFWRSCNICSGRFLSNGFTKDLYFNTLSLSKFTFSPGKKLGRRCNVNKIVHDNWRAARFGNIPC